MKKAITTLFILVFGMALSAQQLSANAEASSIAIDGTSNVHDWTETVKSFTGKCSATISDGKLTKISGLYLNIPVKQIKSGKSSMDKNTYEAMNAEDHPNIVFSLKSASISGNKVLCTGTLTISGKTNTVTITSDYKIVGGKLVLSGSYKMKMTDYGIDPPTALLGTMTTGDDLVIRFNLTFN